MNIKWTNNRIEELYKKDDCTYAVHIESGRELWIPNDFIYTPHRCTDCTDCVLSVKKGDALKMVRQTSRGNIVKKDGVTGWYYGGVTATE